MDRKEYLDWCRECAVLEKGVHGIRIGVPSNRIVAVRGMAYYPQAYMIEFNQCGEVIHTAILHDLKANSVISCPLNKVKKLSEMMDSIQYEQD